MTEPQEPQCQNTDRELWRAPPGDYYADSIFVTESGGIGMNVGGFVVVMPLRKWMECVRPPEEPPPDGAALRAEWLQTRLDGSFVAAQDAFVERLLVALESIPAPLRGPSPEAIEVVCDLYAKRHFQYSAPVTSEWREILAAAYAVDYGVSRGAVSP